MNKFLASIAGATLLILPTAAFATTTTTTTPASTVSVNATVNAACTLSTSSALAFNYTPNADANSTGGAEHIQCTNSTAWTINAPATTTVLGPGTGLERLDVSSIAASPSTGTGDGTTQDFTLGGVIVAGQYNSPGAYTGTFTITASF